MAAAGSAWTDACNDCGVRFTHVVKSDGAPGSAGLSFRVRYHDAGGQYIAAAFFPHDPPAERVIQIDPSYFSTSFDKQGVLRHELGHVLGYRHEQARGVPGCLREGTQWQPLTPYDPKSVMHYFCGGAGSLRLELTDIDRAGHRKLYSSGETAGALGAGGFRLPVGKSRCHRPSVSGRRCTPSTQLGATFICRHFQRPANISSLRETSR